MSLAMMFSLFVLAYFVWARTTRGRAWLVGVSALFLPLARTIFLAATRDLINYWP